MVAVDELDLEAYMDEVFGKNPPESKFCSPPPSSLSPHSAPPPDSKKDKKNKKDKKSKKDKKGKKDKKTVKKSKKDTKTKKDKNCKNDKKDEKAKKTQKGIMTVTINYCMTLEVVGSDTIGEVKRVIKLMRHLEGRPPAINMALIFGNKGLADDNTLKFYKIPDKAHLRLEVE